MKKLIITYIFSLLYIFEGFSQTAFFNVSKSADCNILKISIDASSSKGKAPLTYFWDFGNGNTTSGSDKAVVDAIYVQPGEPVISLYVKDANGIKSDVFNKTVYIHSGPKIDFDVSGTQTCLGQTVQFKNKTIAGSSKITGYIWNIGNNISLNEKDPSYTFTNTGNYDVSLVVTDENGCNVNLKKSNLVSVSNSFKTEFKAVNTSACSLPFETEYKDLTDYQSLSGHKFSYNWNFGDGSTSTEQNPKKTYSNPGSMDVQLTVTDLNSKCYSTEKVDNYINLDFRKPLLNIQFKSKNCTEYIYKFSPNVKDLPIGTIKTFDYGDGTNYNLNDTESEVMHSYFSSGKKYIKLTFSNPKNANCSQSSVDSIIVPDNGLDFKASNPNGCKIPFSTSFSTLNINDAESYTWDFGDGTSSAEANPSKTFVQNGNFTIKLKVKSKSGCTYNFEKPEYIKVGPLKASFTSDAKRIQSLPNEFEKHPIADQSVLYGGCVPFEVNFVNTSPAGSNTTSSWDFGDGTKSSSSSANISHTYLKQGIYSPTLSIKDDQNCEAIFTCKDCVKAGEPPVASIELSGPDTVCCLYEKSFAAKIKPDHFDFLWYNIVLNDGGPSPGITQAYYKNSAGNWNFEDNTGTILPFAPAGLGLNYQQSTFALPSGNQPDFYFYAYKNGCATKIEKPKYQTHLLPWGTFKPLPCNEEEELKGGDILDFNKVGGNWILGKDTKGNPMKLSKATVTFEFNSKSGCKMAKVSKTFTAAELGFDIEAGSFQKIQQLGLFPKVKIPECAGKGDELLSTTYLYTHDDATKSYQNGKCECEEHWPYKIGAKKKPSYTLNNRKGCAPLEVEFSSKSDTSEIIYVFENGLTFQGTKFKKSFSDAGVYRFKTVSSHCSEGKWTDSIIVSNPKAKFSINQSAFCLKPNSSSNENKQLIVTDHSDGGAYLISKWNWDLGNGKVITKSDSSKLDITLTEKDVAADTKKPRFIKLTVSDLNNCKSTDSIQVFFRKTTSKLDIVKTTGCYDSLKVSLAELNKGGFPPYTGNFSLSRINGNEQIKMTEADINTINQKALLLDTNGIYKLSVNITSDALGTCMSQFDTVIAVKYQSLAPNFKIKGKTQFSCVPSLVEAFDASAKFAGREIKSWNWKFINQSTNQEVNGTGEKPVPFALTDSGYYSLNLTIIDESGCKKSINKDSVIFINDLRGKITEIPKALCPDEMGQFTGLSTNAQNYFWDFGDGIVGSGLNVKHSYKSTGEKNISFIVTDTSNCKRSYTGKLLVKKAPVFELGNDTLICEKEQIIYSVPKDLGYVYKWNNGNLTSSITINSEGLYTLLIQDTIIKCNYKDSVKVSISKLPTVSIDSVPPVCKGEDLVLSGHTNGLGKKFEWIRNNLVVFKTTLKYNMVVEDNPLITLNIINADGCNIKDSIRLNILQRPVVTLSNQSVCPEDSIILKPQVQNLNPLFKWHWTFNSQRVQGDTFNFKSAKVGGLYGVTYGKENCLSNAVALLNIHPLPDTKTNPEKVNYCEEFGSIYLDGGKAHSYLWFHEGETQKDISISKPGLYILKLGTEHNCYKLDTVEVESRCAPQIFVPTAFTPELAGENKIHKIFGYNIGSFSIVIFNRWGEIIYESKDIKQPWDGYYRNELMPSGVYPWIIKYTGNNPDHTEIKQLEGKVVLER
ncbi:MAG: PKD domain-containing protein [Opitutaceae bacterium]|nr:PKD domain-containing protein [Cytophagales bacterium]